MELPKKEAEAEKIVRKQPAEADRVEIVFYTDPLCCWSWAFEPQWRRLQYEYQECIVFKYVMTGLLPSWKNYSDQVYSVSKPMQMGAVWHEAADTSGMPIHDRIWVEDPPASSYPACIAVKSAQLQSQTTSVKYLRRLREAVMLHGKNIAKQDVLIQVAEHLSKDYPGLLNVKQFANDLINDKGLEAFRTDWQDAQNRNITRTPTLIMRAENRASIMLTGYRPYAVLLQAIQQMLPHIQPSVNTISIDAYKRFWGNLTEREVAEIT